MLDDVRVARPFVLMLDVVRIVLDVVRVARLFVLMLDVWRVVLDVWRGAKLFVLVLVWRSGCYTNTDRGPSVAVIDVDVDGHSWIKHHDAGAELGLTATDRMACLA